MINEKNHWIKKYVAFVVLLFLRRTLCLCCDWVSKEYIVKRSPVRFYTTSEKKNTRKSYTHFLPTKKHAIPIFPCKSYTHIHPHTHIDKYPPTSLSAKYNVCLPFMCVCVLCMLSTDDIHKYESTQYANAYKHICADVLSVPIGSTAPNRFIGD